MQYGWTVNPRTHLATEGGAEVRRTQVGGPESDAQVARDHSGKLQNQSMDLTPARSLLREF